MRDATAFRSAASGGDAAGLDLSGLILEDPQGRSIRLGDLIDRPTVIDLVRYYGCAPCRAFLAQLAERHDDIVRNGGAILGIGPAAPYQAELLQRRAISFPLLLDPDRRTAGAIGLGRQSLLRFLFDPRGWWRWLASWFRGGRQGLVTAGWEELPAVVVLDARGRAVWVYRGRFIGDYPPLADVLRHLTAATDGAAA